MVNKKFNYENHDKHSACAGYFFLILFVLVFLGHCHNRTGSNSLISPLSDIDATPQEAEAYDVVINCHENVENYLECKAAKNEITYRDADILTAIAEAESHFNPEARNPESTARGVFQILAGTWYSYDCIGDKWKMEDNTDCAIKIYKKSGNRLWNASKSVWGKKI